MMKKKIYLSVDWDSRSISVSTKNDWDEYKEYLKEEGKCGVYREGNSLEKKLIKLGEMEWMRLGIIVRDIIMS